MLRAQRTVVLSMFALLAALPPAAGAMAGDASGAGGEPSQEAPPPVGATDAAPPPPPAPEQRVEPKKERIERQQDRVRDDPDRAQQMEQRQQDAERARAEREQQKQDAERARAEREQRQQEAERTRAEREQQKQEAERARAESEQQKQDAERARAESEQQKQDAERARAESEQQKQDAERTRQVPSEPATAPQPPQEAQGPDGPAPDRDNAQSNTDPALPTRPERDAERTRPRDGERRRPDNAATPPAQNTAPAPLVVSPPTSPGTAPADGSPPAREADRAVPREEKRRRLDRDAARGAGTPPAGGSTGNAQPETAQPLPTPAAGAPPNVQRPPVREEARRAVGRDTIRESYKRAPGQQRSFDDLKRNRRERTLSQGNLRVIEEPDRRVIVKQNNRTFIRHDESERFRRIAPDARTIRRADGTSTTFMTRSGGVRVYDVTDRNGRLLQRTRRYPNGREVILIDNRRHYGRTKSRTRDVLIGAGIGLVLGSAIALAAPEVRIPRDRYIVDYGRASDDDLYEALTAPPIERLDRGYSLDEVRYSRHLRDRMRRIDLNTVTFDFGSWEVGPDQGRALDRLADGINRVLQRNPDEIFMIEGHTDAVGSQEDNLTLSDRRAQSVAEILTTEYGVAPENLVTQGYGEEHLKIPTEGPERLNRRITVRRIGPLLSGRFDDERYSRAPPVDDRTDGRGRGYEDLDDGPPGDGLPDVVPPDDGRTYDYDRDRYR